MRGPADTTRGPAHAQPSDAAADHDDTGRPRQARSPLVPQADHDPAWVLALPTATHPADIAVQETLLSLCNGRFGTRGSLQGATGADAPRVVAAGVYTDDDERRILCPAPDWTAIDGPTPAGGRRLLDLRAGVLWSESATGTRSVRFVSLARPGIMGLRAELAAPGADPGDALRPCDAARPRGCASVSRSTRGGGIAAAATQQVVDGPATTRTVERLAAYVANPARAPAASEAERVLATATDLGFDALLAEHRSAWAARWAAAAVAIDGDAQDQLAARFALFHLLSAAREDGEAGVGARGLTGPAYDGHVFWDADVFVLPALAATRPRAARAMVQYRIARLAAARRRARRRGLRGALWPWESTDDGEDVTPPSYRDRYGHVVAVRTGGFEQHIVADVAWAACHYATWAGDEALLAGAGRPLVLDGARFWASRARWDGRGRAHIDGVIGPDEYHELVDDNAFTNVMARWNLRRAARLADAHDGAEPDERARWRALADALVDGYDPRTGRYEQFAGFDRLTPLRIADVARPPVAADLLLGRDVVEGAQVVKQADVLMLHHLVPDDVAPGSLRANLEFYGPRTAHGSSLSPAIHAALWARAGRPDQALELFRVAARLDLDDLTGTTANGLHLATHGGVWQALAFGFLGLRATSTALIVDPDLPAAWDAVTMTVICRGTRVTVRATHDAVHITCDRPLTIRLRGGATTDVAPSSDGVTLPLEDEGRGA